MRKVLRALKEGVDIDISIGSAEVGGDITDTDGQKVYDKNGKVITADVDNEAVDTDKEGLTGGDGLTTVRRDSNGNVVRENHNSIQGAIDHLAQYENRGMVELYSKGDKGEPGGGFEVSERITISEIGESRFVGNGIGCRIHGNTTDEILYNATEDTQIAWMWIDQDGDGNAVTINQNTHVHDINIDSSGYDSLVDIQEGDWSCFGPYVEIKSGPHAAITSQGYSTIIGNHIVKVNDSEVIKRGIRITGPNVIASNNIILQDGSTGDNWGVMVDAGPTLLDTIHVGKSPQLTGATQPAVGYDINASDVHGRNLREEGVSADGIRINNDVTNVHLQGDFPSGVNFRADITTPGEVVIEGRVGSINESSAGYKNGQVVNGNSWNSGDPNTTGIWNGNASKAFRKGVTVWDTSVSPNVKYEAGPDGNWN